jgi:hypothetical protein
MPPNVIHIEHFRNSEIVVSKEKRSLQPGEVRGIIGESWVVSSISAPAFSGVPFFIHSFLLRALQFRGHRIPL